MEPTAFQDEGFERVPHDHEDQDDPRDGYERVRHDAVYAARRTGGSTWRGGASLGLNTSA